MPPGLSKASQAGKFSYFSLILMRIPKKKLLSNVKRLLFSMALPMTVFIALWGWGPEGKAGERSFHISSDVVVKITSLETVALPPGKTAEKYVHSPPADRLLGTLQHHVVQKKETLLDIARQYDLGFNEMQELYPHVDPWIPPEGMQLVIPSQHIIPESEAKGIIINVPEMRMYYFPAGVESVRTYPVGLGERDYPTPVGTFRIGKKRINPAWHIPSSLQYKYPVKVMPPGPDNPLGKYWMRLEGTDYGIHGTDIPWAIGRLVTHGCIRMYPEDIPQFFKLVKPGTMVRIIYEPVKIGWISGRIFVEIHRDIYNRIEDLAAYGWERLREKGLLESVDQDRFRRALDLQDGLPTDITL